MKGIGRIRSEDTKSLVRGAEAFICTAISSVIYFLVWKNEYSGPDFPDYYYNGKYVLMGVYFVLLYVFVKSTDGFQFADLNNMDVVLAQWIAFFIVNAITYFQLCLIANHMITPVPMLILMVYDLVLSSVLVVFFAFLNRKIYHPHKMLMIFGTDVAVTLKIKLDTRKDKYNIKKLISVNVGFDKLCEEILNHDAVILSDVQAEIRNDLLKFCYAHNISVYATPKLTDVMLNGSKKVSIFDTPLFMVKCRGLNIIQRFLKRTLDLLVSIIALIVLSPLFLLVAAAIKIEDRGPVFYLQDRVTVNNKDFKIFKFRSMRVNSETSPLQMASDNDPRITKVGKFIRATRIDELPQILNVIKGDMSLVGPRPERRSFINEYKKAIPEFDYRLKVKGGLTGYAQVYGKYNTTPYDKLRMDLMYIENYSLLLDIKLLLTTVRIIFKKESTEGIDKAHENENLRDEIIKNMSDEKDF